MNYFQEYPPISEVANILDGHPGINQYIKQDPLRLEGFLKDVYGMKYKKEIFLLVTAARAKVNERLDKISNNKYPGPILRETISYLSSTYSLEEKSAAWTTIVWAMGSKKLTEIGYERFLRELRLESSRGDIDNIPIIANSYPNSAKLNAEIMAESDNIPINCNTSESFFELGNSLHNQGKFVEAIECYDKALLLNPQDHNLLSNKGLALHNQGKFVEAIECYDKALLLKHDDTNILCRKNYSVEILQRNSRNQISSNLVQPKSSRKRSPNHYLMGFILTAGLLITGVIAYAVLELPNVNKQYLLSNQQSDSNYNLNNTESKETQQSKLQNYSIDKQSISIFTDNIENEINNTPSNTEEVQTDVSNRHSGSNIGVAVNNTLGKDTEIDFASKTVNKFKSELSKAMKTSFD